MNLEEFIKDVLISLDRAVESARVDMKRDVQFAATEGQRTVEFDIAVSAEETDTKSGEAGIRVLQFAEGGGEIAKENKSSTVSRIKFGINVDALTKSESDELSAVVASNNEEQRNRFEL